VADFTGKYDGVQIFSATMANEREQLGARVTEWIAANNGAILVVHTGITQSSDSEFHCVTITVFYNGKAKWNPPPKVFGSKNRNQGPTA